MKYTEEFLISEIARYIKERGEYPKSTAMRIKYSYPPISAYTSTFGSWQNAIDAYEDTLFPTIQIETNIIDKYTVLCQEQIYKLALKYPNISVLQISEILEAGYLLGIAAEIEAMDVEIIKDLYL